MKFSFKNIKEPTPAKWSKIGVALTAVSGFISASAFSTDHSVLGWVSIGAGAVGTFLTTWFASK